MSPTALVINAPAAAGAVFHMPGTAPELLVLPLQLPHPNPIPLLLHLGLLLRQHRTVPLPTPGGKI